jgi:hypothetical protein
VAGGAGFRVAIAVMILASHCVAVMADFVVVHIGYKVQVVTGFDPFIQDPVACNMG